MSKDEALKNELADEMAALDDSLGVIAVHLGSISDSLTEIADAFREGKLYISGTVATYDGY